MIAVRTCPCGVAFSPIPARLSGGGAAGTGAAAGTSVEIPGARATVAGRRTPNRKGFRDTGRGRTALTRSRSRSAWGFKSSDCISRAAGCLTPPGSAEPGVDDVGGDTANQAAIRPPPATHSAVKVRVIGLKSILARGATHRLWAVDCRLLATDMNRAAAEFCERPTTHGLQSTASCVIIPRASRWLFRQRPG